MDVFFNEIPEEGLHLDGEFPQTIFDLAPEDPIRPTGPVSYEADIHAFEEVVALSGRLHGPFELQCSFCLEYFPFQADFPDWNSEVDREPGAEKFDLQELVREDFLLHLPSHPRCDEWVPGRVCPRAEIIEEHLGDPEEAPGDDAPNRWSALDDWK